jgi:membrane protein DedA with SNARE-associated domain
MTQLLAMWGYPIVALFVALESSGIPVPGETLLLAAATYSGMGHLRIQWVIVAAALGAILGDNLGYTAGMFGGRALVERYGKYVHIRSEELDRAGRFFARYGDRTVFFGRFVSVLRAWVAILAGTNRMSWPKFLVFNAAGGITWATIYGLLGYFLGNNLALLHGIVRVITVAGIAVAVIAALVVLVLWRRRRARRALGS